MSIVPGRVIILQTMDGSPSAKAGMGAGDEILAINNIALGRSSPINWSSFFRKPGKGAALDIRHPGNTRVFGSSVRRTHRYADRGSRF